MPPYELTKGDGPILAVAVHDGHAVRDEVGELLALSDADRLREEDPYTGLWTQVAGTRIVARNSRFQVDLNRPPEKAVYGGPEDAWGLDVWKRPPPEDVVRRSLAEHDAFYAEAHRQLSDLVERHGRVLVLDIHSYNHLRDGPDGPPADPEENPEVNVGTGTMDRRRWSPLVDRFLRDLGAFDFLGRHLDVRENVKFRGGRFSRWVHETFPESACALALEFRKSFMDEWTGELDRRHHEEITRALASAVAGALEELAVTEPHGADIPEVGP